MKRFIPTLILPGILFCVALMVFNHLANNHPVSTQDRDLRIFMSVSSISSEYTIPDGNKVYLASVLTFEDGKLTGWHGGVFGPVEKSGKRTVTVEVMWGQYQGASRIGTGRSIRRNTRASG